MANEEMIEEEIEYVQSDDSTWRVVAIINTIITVFTLAGLILMTLYYKDLAEEQSKIESANTRVEINYVTKIFDGVEFIYPTNGIIRDIETDEDSVIEKFNIVEKKAEGETSDIYQVEFIGTNYVGEDVNIFFDEFDAEGNYVDELFLQFEVNHGKRTVRRSTIEIPKDVVRIEVRLQENAVLNFGEGELQEATDDEIDELAE